MKKIISISLILISVTSFAQDKYFDKQRIDSLYGKFYSGSSTDSVVTVNSLGKFFKRNASSFGISAITADNGLTANTSTNVQLGGPLTGSTTIAAGSSFDLTVTATSSNTGFSATNSSSGTGGSFSSISGTGMQSSSVNGIPVHIRNFNSGADTVVTFMKLSREPASAGADGLGGSLDFYTKTDASNIYLSNQLISKLTTAADLTRTSQFIITGVNSGTTNTLLTLDGDQTATFFGNVHLNNSGSLYLQTTNSFSGDMPANSQPVINSINSNRVEAINLGAYTYVLTSAAASLSLSSNSVYSFTGTTSTWTLPAITSNTGMSLVLKNRGSGTITLNTNAGATDIYDTSAISTMNITAGQCIRLVNDGTYWIVISKY